MSQAKGAPLGRGCEGRRVSEITRSAGLVSTHPMPRLTAWLKAMRCERAKGRLGTARRPVSAMLRPKHIMADSLGLTTLAQDEEVSEEERGNVSRQTVNAEGQLCGPDERGRHRELTGSDRESQSIRNGT